MFQIGGTDVFVHKYLGSGSVSAWNPETTYQVETQVSINNKVYKAIKKNKNKIPPNTEYWEFVREGTASQPVYQKDDIFNIQDLLFLENRDRKYSDDVYILRGIYNVQDIDFNLSQFGLFLQNDTIFVTFHINDTVDKIGRKLVSGDVIELPHLKDDHALNDLKFALKRFYVIEDVNRAAEGFSPTWYPHLYRAKCKPLVDSQEFKDILDGVADEDNSRGEWQSGITYYPDDVVIGPDGKNYTCIDPIGTEWQTGSIYYSGDVVIGPDGIKYIVVDNNILLWNGNQTYMPGDQFTGPDGQIYQVNDTDLTQVGVTGQLPPDADYYTKIQGTGVTGVEPLSSDRYKIINVPEDGITDILPPNMIYWEISETLRDIVSTYEKEMQITKAVLDQAEEDSPLSGRDTTQFFHLSQGEDGRVEMVSVDANTISADAERQATDEDGNLLFDDNGDPIYVNPNAAAVFQTAKSFENYLYSGDGVPPNGAPFTAGIAFPLNPTEGEYCLRKDYFPYRLFRYSGRRWQKMEDKVRMTMSNLGPSDIDEGSIFEGKDVRLNQKSTFINNDRVNTINGKQIPEKQSLSKALRPKADG
jgi:hypothetical protein